MLIMMTLYSTYTRPMMWYSPLPLGMRKMVNHMHSKANYPVPNDSCIISTTIHHLGESGYSSAWDTASQTFRCSNRIPYRTRTNLEERASGIIQFPHQPGPHTSHKPALTLRLWDHLVYYYIHHNSHYCYHNMPKGYSHVIVYNQTITNVFIKM